LLQTLFSTKEAVPTTQGRRISVASYFASIKETVTHNSGEEVCSCSRLWLAIKEALPTTEDVVGNNNVGEEVLGQTCFGLVTASLDMIEVKLLILCE
jgi:hypothetical protein